MSQKIRWKSITSAKCVVASDESIGDDPRKAHLHPNVLVHLLDSSIEHRTYDESFEAHIYAYIPKQIAVK